MRDNMHRVLVTRARLGGKIRRKGRARRPEEMPSVVGMKRSHALTKVDMKMLNEYLQPLRRYLHAQVGRPWDKVWSEIAAGLRVSSAVQQHVRDHVFDFVAKDVSIKEREVWVREHGRECPLRDSMRELWIDPRTGILRHNRRRVTPRQALRARREQAERELRARMVPGKDNVQYHRLGDGAWWEVTLACEADLPSPDAIPPTDVVLAVGLSALPTSELYGRDGVYAVDKRQLSTRGCSIATDGRWPYNQAPHPPSSSYWAKVRPAGLLSDRVTPACLFLATREVLAERPVDHGLKPAAGIARPLAESLEDLPVKENHDPGPAGRP